MFCSSIRMHSIQSLLQSDMNSGHTFATTPNWAYALRSKISLIEHKMALLVTAVFALAILYLLVELYKRFFLTFEDGESTKSSKCLPVILLGLLFSTINQRLAGVAGVFQQDQTR